MKEKKNWPNENPKLEDARRVRGIYVIERKDEEFKEITQNARKKLEEPAAPAVHCKKFKKQKVQGIVSHLR